MSSITSLAAADAWRLTSASAGQQSTLSPWARCNELPGAMGSGMSYASGIFTFPLSGVWWIQYTRTLYGNTGAGTTDEGACDSYIAFGSGGGFTHVARLRQCVTSQPAADNYTMHSTGTTDVLVDVDAAISELKINVDSTNPSDVSTAGSSSSNRTSLIFIRLGAAS